MSNITIVSENEKGFSVLSIEAALISEHHKVYNHSFKTDVPDDCIQSSKIVLIIGCEEIEEYKVTLLNIKRKCLQ